MSLARAIFVVLTAFSIVLLPVTGADVFKSLSGASHVVAAPDCCAQAKHCDRQTKGDCGQTEACVAKCSNVSATLLEAPGAALALSHLGKVPPMAETAETQLPNPPAPPPRA